METLNIKAAIDGQKKGVTGLAFWMFVVSALLMAVDGYDVTSLSLAVSSMATDWGMQRGDFGWIMSVANVGLIFGSFLFGWIGDKFGRKTAILSSLLLFAITTYTTTLATTLPSLCVHRVLVSLGVGGLTPNVVALNNDLAPERSKMKRSATLFVGMNFGSATTGFVAAWAMSSMGWKGIFYVGTILPLIMFVIALFVIPESVSWLVVNNKPYSRIEKALKKIRPDITGITPQTKFIYSVEAKATKSDSNVQKTGIRDLFDGKLKWITPLLWANFVICLFVAYFFKSWMPTILVLKGMTDTAASVTTSMMMFGSMAGSATIGFILDRVGLRKASFFPILLFCIACLFGMAPADPVLSVILIMCLGYAQSSCYAINPAMTPLFYPVNLRSSASGINLGVGRIGSIVAPILGGMFINTGMSVSTMFFFVVSPEWVSAILLFVMMTQYMRSFKQKDLYEEAQAEARMPEQQSKAAQTTEPGDRQ